MRVTIDTTGLKNKDKLQITPVIKNKVILTEGSSPLLQIDDSPESQKTIETQYYEQIDPQVMKTVKQEGATASTAMSTAAAGAGAAVGVVSLFGSNLIIPLMALFQILKLVNRLKLINISYGAVLEEFLSQIGNLFQISGFEKDPSEDIARYKSRGKLDE